MIALRRKWRDLDTKISQTNLPTKWAQYQATDSKQKTPDMSDVYLIF